MATATPHALTTAMASVPLKSPFRGPVTFYTDRDYAADLLWFTDPEKTLSPIWTSFRRSEATSSVEGSSTINYFYGSDDEDVLAVYYNTKPVISSADKFDEASYKLTAIDTASLKTSATTSKHSSATSTDVGGPTVTVTVPAAASTIPQETNPPSPTPAPGLSSGAKAGISVGAILGVVLLSLIIFFTMRHMRRRAPSKPVPDLPEVRDI